MPPQPRGGGGRGGGCPAEGAVGPPAPEPSPRRGTGGSPGARGGGSGAEGLGAARGCRGRPLREGSSPARSGLEVCGGGGSLGRGGVASGWLSAECCHKKFLADSPAELSCPPRRRGPEGRGESRGACHRWRRGGHVGQAAAPLCCAPRCRLSPALPPGQGKALPSSAPLLLPAGGRERFESVSLCSGALSQLRPLRFGLPAARV